MKKIDRELALDEMLKAWADDKRLTPDEAREIGEAAVRGAIHETGDLSVEWWRRVFLRASVVLDQTNDFRRYLSSRPAL